MLLSADAPPPGRRQNRLTTADWHDVMDSLQGTTSITSLNGLGCLGALFAGGQAEVNLQGKGLGKQEAVVAVARLLARSRSTLTTLDIW